MDDELLIEPHESKVELSEALNESKLDLNVSKTELEEVIIIDDVKPVHIPVLEISDDDSSSPEHEFKVEGSNINAFDAAFEVEENESEAKFALNLRSEIKESFEPNHNKVIKSLLSSYKSEIIDLTDDVVELTEDTIKFDEPELIKFVVLNDEINLEFIDNTTVAKADIKEVAQADLNKSEVTLEDYIKTTSICKRCGCSDTYDLLLSDNEVELAKRKVCSCHRFNDESYPSILHNYLKAGCGEINCKQYDSAVLPNNNVKQEACTNSYDLETSEPVKPESRYERNVSQVFIAEGDHARLEDENATLESSMYVDDQQSRLPTAENYQARLRKRKRRGFTNRNSNNFHYFCKDCNVGFTKKHLLTAHLNDVHVCKCRRCYFIATTTEELEEHLRTHQNDLPYKCDKCDFRALHNFTVMNHFRMTHGRTIF